jgi:hypothetical protein
MILKIFSPKNFAKKIGIFDSIQSYILKKVDHNIGIFAENWQNLQKIVIITSTPGHPGWRCNSPS